MRIFLNDVMYMFWIIVDELPLIKFTVLNFLMQTPSMRNYCDHEHEYCCLFGMRELFGVGFHC